jgi:signal transduction histidine kinase
MDEKMNPRGWPMRMVAHVLATIGHGHSDSQDIDRWKNWAFGISLAYCMPLSLIALVPSLFGAYMDGYYGIMLFDLLAVAVLVVIALVPGIRLGVRKGIFMGLLYGLALMLLYHMGHFGPGLLFLQACTVFAILFYRLRHAVMYLLLNVVICIAIALVVAYTDWDIPLRQYHDTLSWVAKCSNLLFISAVLMLLIHQLLRGLEHTIREQQRLREELMAQSDELRRSLHELEQRNEELDRFAYVASHDLQEPLRMVTGFLDRLVTKYSDRLDDRAREYIHYAHDGAVRMRQSILDLLDYSRTGRDREQAEAVDMPLLMSGIRGDMAERLKDTQGTVSYDGPGTLHLPEAMLRQVLMNLVGNALKYHREGVPPVVRVSAVTEGASVRFAVSDNGIGIAPQHFERIFHIFQRLHGRDEYSGTGIGLAICKKAIERHGGHIRAESDGQTGSTFRFVLPLGGRA